MSNSRILENSGDTVRLPTLPHQAPGAPRDEADGDMIACLDAPKEASVDS